MADLRIARTEKRYDYPPGSIFPADEGDPPAQGIAAGDSASHDLREGYDLLFGGPSWGQFQTEAGLRTAVLLSLFTDRLADADDELPDTTGSFPNRRGYWADFLSPAGPDDRYGSRLWLLVGQPLTLETRAKARAYALEAVEWVRELGIGDPEVETRIPRRGWLEIDVTISDATTRAAQRYAFLWDSMTNEGV